MHNVCLADLADFVCVVVRVWKFMEICIFHKERRTGHELQADIYFCCLAVGSNRILFSNEFSCHSNYIL